MTTFTYLGTNSDFFGQAFISDQDLDVRSFSPTTVVVFNPDTGLEMTLQGTGFAFDFTGTPTGGTINNVTVRTDATGQTEGTVTGVSWDFAAFAAATDELSENDNTAPIIALIEAGGPITLDLSGSIEGIDLFEAFGSPFEADGSILARISQPLTIIGGPDREIIYGGAGNDSITPGSSDDSDFILASDGNDTIDFTGATDGSFYVIEYVLYDDGITVDIDGSGAGFGRVIASGGTDTLANVITGLEADGIEIAGGDGNDTFNITLIDDQNMILLGLGGSDTFDITLGEGSWMRLDYSDGDAGILVDLAGGRIEDSYGATDTVTVTNEGRLEIRGTDFTDDMVGSDGNESFITRGGNDTVDGGGGEDRVRYDRNGYTDIEVDLAAGTATGFWEGTAFVQELINIEEIRGTRDGNDLISGSGRDDFFDGRGGDDSLNGRGGDDLLIGDEGDDNLSGGAGDDTVVGGDNSDTVSGGNGDDVLLGDGGFDRLNGGDGDDFLSGGGQADNLFAGAGNDTLDGGSGLDRLFANGGDDVLIGGDGNDGLFGNAGNDTMDGGAGNDRFFGGQNRDLMLGGEGNDTLNGGAGFDTLVGGAGDDVMFGRFNADTFVFEDGHGNDIIGDFAARNNFERIDLSAVSAIGGLGDLQLGNANGGAATQVGANVLIDTGGGDSITLRGVSLSDLDANDFVF